MTEPATFHAYVHIPFCVTRCGYCDFNTYTSSEIGDVSQAEFHSHLIREIEFSSDVLRQSNLEQNALSTIFFGGGTPSLFRPDQINAILVSLEEQFGFATDVEITLEANPESLTEASVAGYQQAGVNRLSLGVQSFDRAVLKVLDRKHDAIKIEAATRFAKQNGLRLSLDLIYGAPGESLESWKKTLDRAMSLDPEHISAYSLIVEDGTALARKIARGDLSMVDEDLNAEKYALANDFLETAGLSNYEVSNWGEPSRHNVAYWQSQNWWGYGPGAHSHIAGNRFWNHKHPANYAKSLVSGSPAHSIEALTPKERLEERLLLEIRTKWGVEAQLLRDLEVKPELIAEAISNELLSLKPGNRLVATAKGRLLIDGLVVDFLTK